MNKIAIVAGFVVAAASPLSAQFVGALDVGGGVGQLGSGAWLRESRLAPALRLNHRAGLLHLEGDLVERGAQLSFRRSTIEGSLQSPALGVFRASLAGSFLRDVSHPSNPATSASVLGAVSARVGANGAWIGTSRPMNGPTQLNLGLWRSLGSAIFSVTSQTQSVRVTGPRTRTIRDSIYIDTLGSWYQGPVRTVTDSNATQFQRWSDLEARVDWSAGRIALSAAVSGRRSRDSISAMTWGRAVAALQLNSRVAVVASGGTTPAASRSGVSTSRFATFGLRLSPAALLRPALPAAVRPSATAIVVRNVAPGSYKITLRVPSARTVELSGDFNQWKPVDLRETSPNVWEATIPMTPGTHRVNVRVDGDAWTAPPGLPTTDDEFNGRVGILIVR